jgi:hypothetical protein
MTRAILSKSLIWICEIFPHFLKIPQTVTLRRINPFSSSDTQIAIAIASSIEIISIDACPKCYVRMGAENKTVF